VLDWTLANILLSTLNNVINQWNAFTEEILKAVHYLLSKQNCFYVCYLRRYMCI